VCVRQRERAYVYVSECVSEFVCVCGCDTDSAGAQPSRRKTLSNRDEEKIIQSETDGSVEFIATEGSGGQVVECI